MKIESDKAEILSGVRGSVTMGGPITLAIVNRDWENWSAIMDPVRPMSDNLGLKEHRLAHETTCPRPGHADLAGGIKWHHHDLRNVLERASARETAARVAVGSLARQFLEQVDIEIASHVIRIGEVKLDEEYDTSDLQSLRSVTEESPVRCIDKNTEKRMVEAVKNAKSKRDSLGGVVEVFVRGAPVGLGGFSQWSDRLDGRLAGALMAIQSVKGVEIGLGFRGATMLGSQVHDEIFYTEDGEPRKKRFYRKTNRAGGLEGGMTNGEDIVVRVAAKPISTLNQPLKSVDVANKEAAEAMVERTDNCVIPALGVICEAVAALIIAESFLDKFGADNMVETTRNYRSFLAAMY